MEVLWLILLAFLGISGILIGGLSLWRLQKHLSTCSRKSLAAEVQEIRNLQVEIQEQWDNVYDKMRQMMGRVDRRKKDGTMTPQQPVLESGTDPEALRIQIMSLGKHQGLLK